MEQLMVELQARGGFFVPNKVLTRNYNGGHTTKRGLYTIGPCLCKLNTVDVSNNVDSYWWQPNERWFLPTQIINR